MSEKFINTTAQLLLQRDLSLLKLYNNLDKYIETCEIDNVTSQVEITKFKTDLSNIRELILKFSEKSLILSEFLNPRLNSIHTSYNSSDYISRYVSAIRSQYILAEEKRDFDTTLVDVFSTRIVLCRTELDILFLEECKITNNSHLVAFNVLLRSTNAKIYSAHILTEFIEFIDKNIYAFTLTMVSKESLDNLENLIKVATKLDFVYIVKHSLKEYKEVKFDRGYLIFLDKAAYETYLSDSDTKKIPIP